MTVADPAGDAPAAGGRDGLPRRGFRRLAEQGPGLLEGPVPSQSLQPLTPVRAHLRQAMTSSSYAGNPRFGFRKVIAAGRLGRLWRVHSRMDFDDPVTLEAGPTGGLLRDLGSHLVDQMLWCSAL